MKFDTLRRCFGCGMGRRLALLVLGLGLVAAWLGSAAPALAKEPAAQALRWWKGNTHVHSRWSDGRDYPEMVAEWYKSRGYHFLVLTDHNILQEGAKWAVVAKPEEQARLEDYRRQFGDDYVRTRPGKEPKTGKDVTQVRVPALAEYRARYEEPGRFLFIGGEEITDRFEKTAIHFCGWNLARVIPPQTGAGNRETIANNVAAVSRQEQSAQRPMLIVLNHPNWERGIIPIEDYLDMPDPAYFELLNGPSANPVNAGDATRLSTDRLWDVALAKRLGGLGLGPIYGVAADDCHNVQAPSAGSGWIVVRAADLAAESLIAAMKVGQFYATTGVRLKDVRRRGSEVAVEIDAEPGVTYTTQFIGTLRGYDTSKEQARDDQGALLPPTQRYSPDVGQVLKETTGPVAAYALTGRELYVRAKIVSSKKQPHPEDKEQYETAWTQPWVAQP